MNNITFYYAQHVLNAPNRLLRPWLYDTIRADLRGEEIQFPCEGENIDPSITY